MKSKFSLDFIQGNVFATGGVREEVSVEGI